MDPVFKKKYLASGMAAFLPVGVLAGCGGGDQKMEENMETEAKLENEEDD